jgi:hypothetical protein
MDLFRLDAASWLRNAIGAGGVYLLSGAGAVTYWRSTDASPGAGELALWLIGAPTMLLLAAAGIWRWRAARRQPAVETSSASPVNAAADDGPAFCADDPVRAAPLHLIASALWLPVGRDAAEVVDALRQQRRPGLHPALRDLQGFPVTVATIGDLDEADAEWALDPDEGADDALRRALALLRPVAEDLLLAALPDAVPDTLDDGLQGDGGPRMHPYAMHHSQSVRSPASQQQATLHIVLLVPMHWPGSMRSAATSAIDTLAALLGHDPLAVETSAQAIQREADAWHVLEQMSELLRDSMVRDDRVLVLAADSLVTETLLEHLQSNDCLLRSGIPEGEVPGEGAAGLLLGAVDVTAGTGASATNDTLGAHDNRNADADAQAIHLHLPLQARLTEGARTRDAARITGELIARTLASAGLESDAALHVVTSADHRPSRMTEVATALVAQRPDLDPIEDVLHLGVACGSLGVAGPMALLALAAAHARETATSTLACAVADASTRAVAVLAPATPASLAPAASSAA